MNISDGFQASNGSDMFEEMIPEEDFSFGYMFHVVLSYILFYTAKSADALIIYAYFKYPVVRTWENFLVLHWAVASFSFVIIAIVIDFIILRTILNVRTVNCVTAAAYRTSVIMTLLFADAILFDFAVKNCKYRLSDKLERSYKIYFVYVLYVASCCIYIVEYFTCKGQLGAQNIVFFEALVFLGIFINMMVLFSVPTGQNRQDKKYTLYAANVIIFSFLPMVIFHYLITHFLDNSTIMEFLLHAHSIPRLVQICNSIAVCVVLYRYDKYFGTALLLTARKCFCISKERDGWNDLTEQLSSE